MDRDSDEPATVLVVDDEASIADLYTAWLTKEYEVRTAYEGEEAVTLIDDSLDIIVLDRNMPRYSGQELLRHIHDTDTECLVAIVSGLEPDTEIVEQGFDDYLVKPVSADELRGTVERLATRLQYDPELRAYFALVSQRAAIEQSEKSPTAPTDSELLEELTVQLESERVEVEELLDSLSAEELQKVLRSGFGSNPL